MTICPRCNSWRVNTEKGVINYSRCRNCGWTGIVYIEKSLLSSPLRQHHRLLHRPSWVYVIFILLILGDIFLISNVAIAPAKYSVFLDKLPLVSEESGTAGETQSKSVTTEAPVIPVPSTQSVPNLPTVYPADAESVSLHEPEKYAVVANSNSEHYHLPGMQYYNKIPSDRRVIFPSEEAAQQAGYHKAPK